MHKLRQRKSFKAILLLCFMSTIFYFGCKKLDIAQELEKDKLESLSVRFFHIPANTSPSVRRVIAEMEKRNKTKEFILDFANRNGFPVWNKIIEVQKGAASNHNSFVGGNASAGATDTVLYIPLVLQNGTVTNGFITSVLNDSISLSYSLAKDYKNYPLNNASANEGGTKFSTFLMLLDHEVFGHSEFEITDKRLFNFQNSHSNCSNVKIKIKSIETSIPQNNNLLAGSTTTICWIAQSEASAAGTCSCGSGGCWCWNDPERMGNGCCSNQICIDITVGTGNQPPGWPSGGGGSGSGGGSTGGGGQIPYVYPCTPVANPSFTNNSLTGDPLPPCPPPSGGTGWIPTPPFNINNPCNVIDSLMKTNNFPIYYNTLRNNVNLNYEKGYLFSNPFLPSTTYTEADGIPNLLGISMSPAVPIDGAVHNHYIDSLSLSVFSFDDFAELHKWFTTGKIANIKSFTFGMVSDSTSYIMMITDPVAFANFGNLFFSDPENTIIFKYAFYDAYGINESKIDTDNEKSFLNALQGLNSGISLFKGNSTISNFSRIKVNESNQVRPWPCN